MIDNPLKFRLTLFRDWIDRPIFSPTILFTISLETINSKENWNEVKSRSFSFIDLTWSDLRIISQNAGINYSETEVNYRSRGYVICGISTLNKNNGQYPLCNRAKLTLIVRHSLGRNCKTAFIGHIHTDNSNYDESLKTLKFIKEVMKTKNKPKININDKWVYKII